MAQTTNGLKKSIWASGPSHYTPPSTSYYARSSLASTDRPNPTPPPSTTHSIDRTPGPGAGAAAAAVPPSSPRDLPPVRTLQRLEQTCLRLHWKSLDLESAYRRTLEAEAHGFSPDVAERNFKLDFYEFYAWIEQALVLSQRIFGIEIANGRGYNGRHLFHHNVIQELKEPTNPLNGVMGEANVLHALLKAKELRNRWKDAADGQTETPPLGMYDLRWIFGQILAGLERSYVMAKEEVMRREAARGGEGQSVVEGDQNDEWEWMVDESMDWEA